MENLTHKHCHACDTTKPVTEFNKNTSKSDGLQTQCKICKASATATWYQKNKTRVDRKNNKQRKKRYRKRRKMVWNYLLDHPCVDCGEDDPIVLEFDHVRGEKVATVPELIRYNRSKQVILDEMAKCDIRCANCHRRKTARQLGWYIGEYP